MISLRRTSLLAAASIAVVAASGCSDGPIAPAASGLRLAKASFDIQSGSPATLDARVLLDKAGRAYVEFHTGTFDDVTNTGTPNGTFAEITYKVMNGGTTVVTRTVDFNHAASSYYAPINLCASSHNTGDDDDDDDNGTASSSCTTKWSAGFTLSATASIVGLDAGSSQQTVNGVPAFQYAVFATSDLRLTGNARTDSYNGALGRYSGATAHRAGSVAAISSITLTGNATINGDATSMGTIRGGKVTGTTAQRVSSLPAYTAPSCPANGYTPASALPTPLPRHVSYNQNTGVLSLSGNATLPLGAVSQYYFSQVTLSGSSSLTLAGAQHVDLYVGNKLSLSGGGIANSQGSAALLTIWGCGSSTADWSMTGGTDAYFATFAPNHDIAVTGNGDVYGATVGHDVTGTGNATFHYDESLGTPSGIVTTTARVENLPDIDLSQQQLYVVGTGGSQAVAGNVNPGTPTTFSVPFPNNKAIGGVANTVGAQTVCVVTVDGIPQLPLPSGVYNQYTNPNAFGYVGSGTENIAAGTVGSCNFTLSLPAGTHKIVVTAGVLYPGDYDLSNNSTSTFTVNSAVSGPPDVAVSFATADAGGAAGNVRIENAVITAGQTGIKLYVGAQLVSGAAPSGAVPCTLTITNNAPGSQPVVLTGSITLTPTSSVGSCQVTSYVFPTAGTYTAVASVNLAGDPNAANNTAAPQTVTVAAPAPSATVKLSALSFTDSKEAISNLQFQPTSNAGADTVHSGDLASYTATIDVSNLQNASSIPSVVCNATVDGAAVPASAWTTQTLSNVAGSATCGFNWTINDGSLTLHPHTIAFTVTTGSFKNTAIAADTALSGVINAVKRIDVSAGALQVLVNGTWKSLSASDAGIKQGSTDTIRTVITSHSPIATAIDCGPLGPASSSDADASSQLQPTLIGTNTTNVAIPANSSTVFCEYRVSAPQQLALIAINMVASITPSAGQPLDQNPADNVATGVLSVVTGGAFTDIKKGTFNAVQTWNTASESDVAAALAAGGSMTSQYIDVHQLALLVVPTQAVLGNFTLTASVQADSSGTLTSFGTGTVTGSLGAASDNNPNPCVSTGPDNSLGNPNEPQLVYKAEVCAEASPDFPGYQRITVNYNPSLAGTVAGTNIKYVYHNPIVIKVALDFTLTGSQAVNHVTATVTIPEANPVYDCTSNFDFTAFACSTNFNTAGVTVSTP
jgi:hypothetical protein